MPGSNRTFLNLGTVFRHSGFVVFRHSGLRAGIYSRLFTSPDSGSGAGMTQFVNRCQNKSH